MKPSPAVILIEFNELTPALLARFMDAGEIPNFKKLFEQSTIYTTYTDEEFIAPWIQWPTVHSGVPFEEHGVIHVGDGPVILKQKCVAEVLSDAGISVGVFGTMNVNYKRLNGYVVPDPWDKVGRPDPPWLAQFYDAVSRSVKESARHALEPRTAAALAWFCLRHGLSVRTMRAIVRQLLAERRDKGIRWRRAILLDSLSYDVFKHLNRRFKVRFATFFSNSTAHFQHYFWREMEPQAFPRAVREPHPSYKTAILEGYRAMDSLIGRFIRDYPNATLIFCTALSQGPRELESDLFAFHVRDFAQYLNFAGLSPQHHRINPGMSAEFYITCESEQAAYDAARVIEQFTVDGLPLHNVKVEDDKVVVAVRMTTDPDFLEKTIAHPDGRTVAAGSLLVALESAGTGTHRREGALWIRDGSHRIVDGYVPLTAVAPTILSLFGVTPAPHMREPSLPQTQEPAKSPALV